MMQNGTSPQGGASDGTRLEGGRRWNAGSWDLTSRSQKSPTTFLEATTPPTASFRCPGPIIVRPYTVQPTYCTLAAGKAEGIRLNKELYETFRAPILMHGSTFDGAPVGTGTARNAAPLLHHSFARTHIRDRHRAVNPTPL
jgi:hypothetical protein